MSIPDSMIVVQTSTSNLRSQKSRTTCSRLPSSIWPCAIAMRASGTSARNLRATTSMSITRLCTKKTCPSRMSSRRIAAETCLSVYGPT